MGRKLWKRSAAVILMLIVLSTGLVANAKESSAGQEEAVTANAVVTLDQWTVSEECKAIEELVNEVLWQFGMITEMKANGNTLIFVYHFTQDVWGDLTAEEMASYFGTPELADTTSGLPEMVEALGQQFDLIYGLKLDGICYIFVAPDSVPFCSIAMKNELADQTVAAE